MSINRVTISGYLVKDCELRWTQKGYAVNQFCVAVNDGYKERTSGNWIEKPYFLNCVIYDKRAESLEPYLVKGLKVVVDGKITQNVSEKKGEKRYFYNIVVNHIDFVKKSDNETLEKANVVTDEQDEGVKVISRGVEETEKFGKTKTPVEMADYATEKASQINSQVSLFEQMNYDASLSDEDIPF